MNADLRTTRLLLVDDDTFVRVALERALDRAGAFTVVTSGSGEEALAALADARVDAVLTDLQMPGMNGVTLIGHMLERGLRLPVAVMTGQAISPEHASALRQYGIAAVFHKPVNVGTLADELQRALDPDAVGRLRGITLFSVLQLLEVERKSALVVVRIADGEGRLYFENGDLVHAHVAATVGAAAAHIILSWRDPSVEIFYKRRARQRSVTEPLHHILMESARLMDERGQQSAAAGPMSPPAPRRPVVTERPDAPAIREWMSLALQLDGGVGAALVELESGLTLGEAGEDAGHSLEAAAAVATELTKTQLKAMRALGRRDAVLQEIIVQLADEYHVSRLVADDTRVLFVVLDRARANLGLARHQLTGIARQIGAFRGDDAPR